LTSTSASTSASTLASLGGEAVSEAASPLGFVAGTSHALKLGGHVSAGAVEDPATGTHQHSSMVPSEQLPAAQGSPEKLPAVTAMCVVHLAHASP
tara:strand:+ start:322 stop:606 length:285 start_codon:yes stop_codon:yes gene_type:complete